METGTTTTPSFPATPSPSGELSPATPSTTRSSLVRVPVLSKQQISTFPAKGILKGSVQKTPSLESLAVGECRSDYTITTMLNSNGYPDPGGRDAKRRLSRNLLSSDKTDRIIT